ncbi:Hypothetical protein ZAZAV_252 [Cedratvirus Zaza IHUMI]|uniref:Uncharacterized protein n=1 Tax=Cedratvirus Zaza IHUMI TaxID=2126979 RepID=A0A2R8FE65_9VIRU|nr:Hypothetical protein ZAZAV_252 [Cedratvirus Zaza IHUMI]
MFFKAILSVPVACEKKRDHVDITCTFESEEQYHLMAGENFVSIHDLIYNIVRTRKGKGWELDIRSTSLLKSPEPEPDLTSIGSF